MGRLILCLLLLAALPHSARAQGESELDRIEALMGAGDYEGARTSLERWWAAAQDASAGARAQALMLRARLASDPQAAERDYLALALGYPTSTYAPTALLRLGQGFLATGDRARATAYLQRLVDDYPGSPDRTIGLLWLARIHRMDGSAATACALARQGIQIASDDELVARFRDEETAACTRSVAEANEPRTARREAAPTQATEPGAAPPERGTPGVATSEPTGRFAVQAGAFRQAQGAQTLAANLRAAGYQPRVVRIPGSQLLRVRVGRLPDAASASALARRLVAAGFEATVVGDADKERPDT